MAVPPDDADRTDKERSAAEVDAEFAAIIAGLSQQMTWHTATADADVDTAQADYLALERHFAAEATTGATAADTPAGTEATETTTHEARTTGPDREGRAAALERERRRALRRAQRAEEVALFEAGQAAAAADLQADEAHFVPPEPPPVPLPRRRTLVALLLMAVGLVMLVRPSLLQVAPDVVLVLGIGLLVGGFGMLVFGLRPRATDPGDADGWDDGARL